MRLSAAASARPSLWICSSCRHARNAQNSREIPLARSISSSQPLHRGRLPDSPARTRFAPSPTGNLHLGSIRTALFNFLLARRTKGQFLLRLEDTDQKRTVPGAEEKLYKDLRWAGLDWDEGPHVGGPHGPYRQSERLTHYHEHIKSLLSSGQAYRCFCSPERLDELNRRRHEQGLSLGYDRKCTAIDHAEAEHRAEQGDAHVLRFRAPDVWPSYTDLVYGKTGHGAKQDRKLYSDAPVWEDQILIKTDGYPTYHWANVCDDHDMLITHVVRGSEWMSSTPLHVAMYSAKGWKPPTFAHVPLLVDQNKQKLSKRNLDTDIASYRSRGIFPEALTNFAALLGWSHQRKNDIMDLSDLEQAFDLKITKGNTVVSFEKLQHLQDRHGQRRIAAGGEAFEQMIRDVAVALLDKYGAAKVSDLVGKRQLRDVVASMLQTDSLGYTAASDFAEKCSIFVNRPRQSTPPPIGDHKIMKDMMVAASTLTLVPESSWTSEVLAQSLKDFDMAQPGTNFDVVKQWKVHLYHYLRWALLDGAQGPGIPQTMEILGRSSCVARIDRAARITRSSLQESSNSVTKPDIKLTPFRSASWPPAASATTTKV